MPGERVAVGDDGGSSWRHFGLTRAGIDFQRQFASVRSDDRVFVLGAGTDSGEEQLPNAGAVTDPHGMAPCIPGVEVAYDRNRPGVGGPDRESHPGHAVDSHGARAEGERQLEMPAFVEQEEVEVA